MTDHIHSKIHWSFWVIGVLMFIWNLMGCINFIMQMDPDMVAGYRESEQAIIVGRPIWATAAFALAVFVGAAGCLLLLLKKSTAFYFFIASLVGVIITQMHTLSVGISFGAGELVGIIFMPVVVASFLVWYANYAERRGWITAT